MIKQVVVLNILVLLFGVCVGSSNKEVPSYIKRCSKSAPDFDACCLAHGKEALPRLLQGVKEYNIPKLTPLELPLIAWDNKGFKLRIKDARLDGLAGNDLKQVKFDLENKKILVKVFFDKIEITGDYEIDGKLLILSLSGTGKCNITAVNLDVDYNINYVLETRDGDEYFKIDTSSADFTTTRAYFDIGNIVGGNDELSESTNKALDQEWDKFLEALKPFITETIVKIGDVLINGLASTVPLKNVFLD